MTGVVILGAGHAGVQLAVTLREAGYREPIELVGDEPGLPYQRPPLSKAFMLGKLDEAGLCLRQADLFEKLDVNVRFGERAESVDREHRTVSLGSGAQVGYQHLVLATGARNRRLAVPGTDLDGVHYLKTLEEAQALRQRVQSVRNVVVIGAGFIGLEFAAVASGLGARVTVVELGSRVMGRAVSESISSYFTARHEERGVEFEFETGVKDIQGVDGKVVSVRTSTDRILQADLVLIGIGVIPNSELAEAANLDVGNGIKVDEYLLTNDPHISAIGDCASYPNQFAASTCRLESVQNAVDHARAVANRIVGKSVAYHVVPWFWSDQGADKLQIAGIATPCDAFIEHGSRHDGKFSVFCFRAGKLVGVESVNRPADHMGARKLLQSGAVVTAQQLSDASFDLKSLTGSLGAAA